MEKINVLYIHGYKGSKDGGTATLFRKHMPECFAFYAIDYDETNAEKALEQVNDFIHDNAIDVVVGSSLGAFLTLASDCLCKVVYNPCYLPSVELPEIECPQDIADTFKQYERLCVEPSRQLSVRAIFTDNDELLGTKYQKLFKEDWPNSVLLTASGPHKMTEENMLKYVIPSIAEVLRVAGSL